MKSYSMFMAAISNWLEMGLTSSRALTAASRSGAPFSAPVRASAAPEAASEAASDAGALEAVPADEDPPQPASRAAQRVRAVNSANNLRFIMDRFLLSVL